MFYWKLTPATGPTIVPAAYATGDVIGDRFQVAKALIASGGQAMLRSLLLIDKADQKAALDLYFFDSDPGSVGADNAAFAPTDAQMLFCLGRLNIATGDYVTAGANAEATKRDLNLLLQALATKDSLWMVVVSRGAPTYASASDLQIRLGLEQR